MKDFEYYVENTLEERFPVKSKSRFIDFLNQWIDDEDDFNGSFYL